MIGSARFTTAFASGADTSDPDTFRSVMKEAARLGFHLVFLETGTKNPVCTLSSVARKQADKEAQEAARDAGDRKWDKREHDCGVKHATDDPTLIDRYLQRRFKNGGGIPNVAIEPRASRMLAVDVDTAQELEGWRRSYRDATGTDWRGGLTVTSPGVVEADGTWKHKDGGHIWWDLSVMPEDANRDVILGMGDGVFKHPRGWTAMYANRYLLVPPSVRPEGRYEYQGPPKTDGLDWVVQAIGHATLERLARKEEARERRAKRLANPATGIGQQSIIKWSQETTWAELLEPLEWVDTTLVHSCGCPDWTMAPVEDHGSPRSATAHDDSCGASHYTDDEGHTAIHLWTDTRPPYLVGLGPTMTKVQFIAAVHRPAERHGKPLSSEDIAAGLRAHGMSSSGVPIQALTDVVVAANPVTGLPVPVEHLEAARALVEGGKEVPVTPAPALTPLGAPPEAVESAPEPGVVPPLTALGAPPVHQAQDEVVTKPDEKLGMVGYRTEDHFLNLAQAWELSAPPALIEGVIDLGTLVRVIGPSGHGKSFVMADWVMCVASGRSWAGHRVVGKGRVVVVAAEDPAGFARRLLWWTKEYAVPPDEMVSRVRLVPLDVQAASEDWDKMLGDIKGFGPSLVVVDTQAQTAAGFEENSNSDMQLYVRRVRQIVANTGACVVLVHHTKKDGTEARGASSVYGALDAEYKVTSDKATDRPQTITVTNTKSKHRAEWTRDVVGALKQRGGGEAVMTWDPAEIPAPAAPEPRRVVPVSDIHVEDLEAALRKAGEVGMTQGQLRDSVRIAKRGGAFDPSEFAAALGRLVQTGRVVDGEGSVVGSERALSVQTVIRIREEGHGVPAADSE